MRTLCIVSLTALVVFLVGVGTDQSKAAIIGGRFALGDGSVGTFQFDSSQPTHGFVNFGYHGVDRVFSTQFLVEVTHGIASDTDRFRIDAFAEDAYLAFEIAENPNQYSHFLSGQGYDISFDLSPGAPFYPGLQYNDGWFNFYTLFGPSQSLSSSFASISAASVPEPGSILALLLGTLVLLSLRNLKLESTDMIR